MQGVKAIAALIAALAVGAQILQEGNRLRAVRRLGGREALAFYERRRKGTDRALIVIAVLLALGAVGSVVFEVLYHR